MQESLLEHLAKVASSLTSERLASMIDHTLLSPLSTTEKALRLVEEAARYGFACAMVPPSLVRSVYPYARDAGVKLCTVAGFPSGFMPGEAKAVEVRLVSSYVDEIDIVAPLWAAAEGDHSYVVDELSTLVEEARSAGVKIIKVIVEAPLVDDEALVLLVRASKEAGADFVKTSTGVYSKGGDPATVLRLASVAKPHGLQVKAAGGIRTGLDAVLAIAAGASRIGTSSGVRVLESFRELIGEKA